MSSQEGQLEDMGTPKQQGACSEAEVVALAPSPLALPTTPSHQLCFLENKCVPELNLFGWSGSGLEARD